MSVDRGRTERFLIRAGVLTPASSDISKHPKATGYLQNTRPEPLGTFRSPTTAAMHGPRILFDGYEEEGGREAV